MGLNLWKCVGGKPWVFENTLILADFGEFVPRDNNTFNNSDSHG